jgi:hypothetical protein
MYKLTWKCFDCGFENEDSYFTVKSIELKSSYGSVDKHLAYCECKYCKKRSSHLIGEEAYKSMIKDMRDFL